MSQITAIYPCFLAGLKSNKPPANLLAGGFSDLLNIVFLNIIFFEHSIFGPGIIKSRIILISIYPGHTPRSFCQRRNIRPG